MCGVMKPTEAIRDTLLPRNEEGKVDFKRIAKRWVSFMAICGVVGTMWSAFSYVKDKLDSIEESSASISDVKIQNAELAERIDELEDNLEAAINERTLATQEEFSDQRAVDVELRGSISSVLQEVRLRHGAVPTPTGTLHPVRHRAAAVRDAVRETDRAQARAQPAPGSGPLDSIGSL